MKIIEKIETSEVKGRGEGVSPIEEDISEEVRDSTCEKV